MVVSNIFNNLNLFATSERYSFVLGFFNPHNNLSNSIFHSLAVLLLNAVSYLYILIKFYNRVNKSIIIFCINSIWKIDLESPKDFIKEKFTKRGILKIIVNTIIHKYS